MTQPRLDPIRSRGLDKFLALLERSVEQGDLVKLVLAKYQGGERGLNQLVVRCVVLRDVACLSMVYRYATRDVTKNLPLAEGLHLIGAALGADFRNAHLLRQSEEIQLSISRRGQSTLRSSPVAHAQASSLEHNREKQRFVDLDRPFLAALGVTTAEHRLIASMSRKWKQINKFVEIFSHALVSSNVAQARQLRVLDFGSGKGYLTFAIHDHLARGLGIEASVTGVELRADMVALCSEAAASLGLTGVNFEQGDVTSYALQPVDVMIALHACDTATDHAIAMGIHAAAQIIMCAPCCHKELRPQLLSPHPLRAILQHGVHLGQEAEMLTDGLRAMLLEASGYATQVFEFVSLEHTSKNKMILAVKRAQPVAPGSMLEQVAEVKRFYGIREQRLERLLHAHWGAASNNSGASR